MKNNQLKHTQKGFSLIELLIVIVVFGFLAYFLTAFMLGRSRTLQSLDENKSASDSAENAIKRISETPYDNLPVAGGFAAPANPGDPAVLLRCRPTICDYGGDQADSGTAFNGSSLAGGTIYQSGVGFPVSARKIFFRRWTIEELDPQARLKRISVGIFESEESVYPLAIVSTVVGG